MLFSEKIMESVWESPWFLRCKGRQWQWCLVCVIFNMQYVMGRANIVILCVCSPLFVCLLGAFNVRVQLKITFCLVCLLCVESGEWLLQISKNLNIYQEHFLTLCCWFCAPNYQYMCQNANHNFIIEDNFWECLSLLILSSKSLILNICPLWLNALQVVAVVSCMFVVVSTLCLIFSTLPEFQQKDQNGIDSK